MIKSKLFMRPIWFAALFFSAAFFVYSSDVSAFYSQQRSNLTPLQLKIEDQRLRLGSSDAEDRRDAISQLGAMHHPDASRVALAGLKDPVSVIRATSASAILSLPATESAANLIPLLGDKDEFVRREAAYALGTTRSVSAVNGLIERLQADKIDEVRSAAAIALGQIGDDGAVSALAGALSSVPKGSGKKKREPNPFVMRAAARSLGQIGNRAALPALLAVLRDEKVEADVKREAVIALGAIGDPSAISVLTATLTASDPHLARSAQEAIKNIQSTNR